MTMNVRTTIVLDIITDQDINSTPEKSIYELKLLLHNLLAPTPYHSTQAAYKSKDLGLWISDLNIREG